MDLSLDLELIGDRLRTQVTSLKKVGGAIAYAEAAKDLRQVPAAFVVPLSDAAGANELATGGVSQMVIEQFNVIYAVSNVRDPRGQAAYDALRPVRGACQAALLAWSPDSTIYDVIEYARGNVLGLTDQVLWWADAFRTRRFARQV